MTHSLGPSCRRATLALLVAFRPAPPTRSTLEPSRSLRGAFGEPSGSLLGADPLDAVDPGPPHARQGCLGDFRGHGEQSTLLISCHLGLTSVDVGCRLPGANVLGRPHGRARGRFVQPPHVWQRLRPLDPAADAGSRMEASPSTPPHRRRLCPISGHLGSSRAISGHLGPSHRQRLRPLDPADDAGLHRLQRKAGDPPSPPDKTRPPAASPPSPPLTPHPRHRRTSLLHPAPPTRCSFDPSLAQRTLRQGTRFPSPRPTAPPTHPPNPPPLPRSPAISRRCSGHLSLRRFRPGRAPTPHTAMRTRRCWSPRGLVDSTLAIH